MSYTLRLFEQGGFGITIERCREYRVISSVVSFHTKYQPMSFCTNLQPNFWDRCSCDRFEFGLSWCGCTGWVWISLGKYSVFVPFFFPKPNLKPGWCARRLVPLLARPGLAMSLCGGHGHYHPFQGECVCAHGWAGKFCEVDAIPACRNASGSALACTTRQEPLPCACVRQCVAAGAFAAHMREPWGAPVCSWRGSYVSWKLDQVGKVQRASDTAKHPLRGASKPAHHWWDGQYESWTCFNGCAGRGACIRGSCVCTANHYGPGCAHQLGDEAREAAAPASQLRLFVYDLPALITGRRSYGSDWDKAHIFSTAQRAFVPALLRDAATLTPDPARADLFVVPAAATNMEALGDYYHHLLRHIRQRWPYWNASRGANHVWMCSGDHGGGVLAGTQGVREGLGLAHYFKGESALLRRGPAGTRPSHLVYAPLLRGATAVARRAYAD